MDHLVVLFSASEMELALVDHNLNEEAASHLVQLLRSQGKPAFRFAQQAKHGAEMSPETLCPACVEELEAFLASLNRSAE